jgi:septal ring factor EnvC (AmiA/AmiB activator)
VKRFQYLKQYREYRRRQAGNIVTTQEQLNQKIQNLESQRVKRSTALKTEQEQRSTLEQDKKEKDQVLNKLKGREKELVADIQQRNKDAQKVQVAIRAVIRREIEEARRKAIAEEAARRKAAEEKRKREEEARKAAALAAAERAKAYAAANGGNPASTPPPAAEKPAPEPEKPAAAAPEPARTENVLEATPEALALSESFEANRGKLPWPVDAGNIIEHFGIHQHAVMEHIQVPSDGIVIATNKGGAVKAIFEGEVKSVVVMPGSGYVIIIRHGQYFTTYIRLQTTRVKKGDNVKTGQVIGTASTNDIENTGEVELQIWKGITKQNPEQWIRHR